MPLKRRKSRKPKYSDSLLVHGRVSEFMSTPPITLTKDAHLTDAKTLMRDHGISGIPIVDDNRKLLGLISLENIIIALEKGYIDDPIEKRMITDVVSVLEDMDVSTVMGYLMNHTYGRYPVTNRDNEVVGVITKGDLMEYLYAKLGNIYMHNARRDNFLSPLEEPRVDKTSGKEDQFSYILGDEDIDHAGEGATLFKKFLKECNCSKEMTRRASISLYEAEVNIVIHANGCGFIKGYFKDGQIVMVVIDNGPGIDNIDIAMQPGWTTASDEVREKGFGAGMGLANIKNYTDKLIILSTCSGVKMEMVVLPRDTKSSKKEKEAVTPSSVESREKKALEKWLKGENDND